MAATPRIFEFRLPIFDLVRGAFRAQLLKSAIANRKSKMTGGKGIRTPESLERLSKTAVSLVN